MAKTKARAARKPKIVKTVTLKIPGELYGNIQKVVQGTGFRSVTEFAIHVLRDVCAGGKLQHGAAGLKQPEVDAVRDRLRALGYIE